jgi:hypothetical protein
MRELVIQDGVFDQVISKLTLVGLRLTDYTEYGFNHEGAKVSETDIKRSLILVRESINLLNHNAVDLNMAIKRLREID